jgi:dGTPase
METFGGFDANAQALRILATLGTKSAGADGLNLTRASLLAILKYPYRRTGPADAAVIYTAALEGHDLQRVAGPKLVATSRFL